MSKTINKTNAPFPVSGVYPSRFASQPNSLAFTGRIELTNDQETGLINFEQGIANITVDQDGTKLMDALKGGTLSSLEANVITDEQQVPVVFLQYFLSNEYKTDNEENIHFSSTQEVEEWFAKESLDGSKKQSLLALATKSQRYAIDSYTKGKDEVYDDYTLINIDPVGAIDQFKKILGAKQVIHNYRVALIDYLGESEDYSPERSYAYGQLMILDIYAAKINSVIASYVPRLVAIINQSVYDIDGYKELDDEIWDIIPEDVVKIIAKSDTWDDLYRTMDEVRNGTTATGPVDESIFNIPEVSSQADGVLSQEEIEILERELVKPKVVIEMIQKVLYAVGLSDWTVEQNPGKTTFQIIGEEKKFYIPPLDITVKRLLTVGVHEFMHVVQSENDSSNELRIAQVKGKRSVGVREAMGKATENEILKLLFGEIPRPAATYARAINTILEGGTPSDAADSFVNQLKSKDRATAADRVIRLLRLGFNSQPMVYAEASRMPGTLEHITQGYEEINGGVTGFDLPDQIRLARVGLLEQGSSPINDKQVLFELIITLKEEPDFSKLIDWDSVVLRIRQKINSN